MPPSFLNIQSTNQPWKDLKSLVLSWWIMLRYLMRPCSRDGSIPNPYRDKRTHTSRADGLQAPGGTRCKNSRTASRKPDQYWLGAPERAAEPASHTGMSEIQNIVLKHVTGAVKASHFLSHAPYMHLTMARYWRWWYCPLYDFVAWSHDVYESLVKP